MQSLESLPQSRELCNVHHTHWIESCPFRMHVPSIGSRREQCALDSVRAYMEKGCKRHLKMYML
jgi:hypothetical protein